MPRKSWEGSVITQETMSSSSMFLRISPSPEVVEVMVPLAITTPASPWGLSLEMMCCIQPKFAFFSGGTPYIQRLSLVLRTQSLMLNGGLAIT